MITLMNGFAPERVKSSEEVAVLDCGCAHTRGEIQRWYQMCDKHHTEFDALHTAAREEHCAQGLV